MKFFRVARPRGGAGWVDSETRLPNPGVWIDVVGVIRCSLRRFLVWAGTSPVWVLAQNRQFSLKDLEGLVEEQVDPQALEAFTQNLDQKKALELLRELQSDFQGEYVLDLAQARQTARSVLPVLEAVPSTRSYAAWLRPRMDYFDVADQLSVDIPPPQARPGQPAPKPSNPTASQERRAWTVQVAKTPVSRGSSTWVPRLKPVFSAERVPLELVWLAEVESAFNPEALSPAGAAGLYQLMPATAQSLGLKLRPQDERLNGDKNARAAAGYLRYLYLKFRDWPLTLAAYNAGEGRVRQTLKSTKGKTFEDISRRLPAETQMYVPKFEAVLKRQERKTLSQLPPARP